MLFSLFIFLTFLCLGIYGFLLWDEPLWVCWLFAPSANIQKHVLLGISYSRMRQSPQWLCLGMTYLPRQQGGAYNCPSWRDHTLMPTLPRWSKSPGWALSDRLSPSPTGVWICRCLLSTYPPQWSTWHLGNCASETHKVISQRPSHTHIL